MERIEIKNDVRWKMKDISVSKYVDLPNTGGVPNGIKDIVHPSYVYIPEGFGGHNFWLAATPYPQADELGGEYYENPCIYYSDVIDGEFPTSGFTAIQNNPIDPSPSDGGYNSDTELVYYDNKLYLFWRTRSKLTGYRTAIYVSSSTDGLVWSAKSLVYGSDDLGNDLCPMYIYYNGKHRIYLNEAGGYDKCYHLKIIECDTIDGLYTENGYASIEGLANIWHGNAFEYGGDVYILAGGQSNRIQGPLYMFLAKKDKNSENFVFFEYPIVNSSYRPCGKVFDDKLVVYNSSNSEFGYSGYGDNKILHPAGNFVSQIVIDMQRLLDIQYMMSLHSY